MNHETAREKLVDLAYGELAPREAAEVAAHLAGCQACRAEQGRIAATRAAMRRLEPVPAPEGGERILVAAAREAAERRRAGRRPILPWIWQASVATALVAAVGLVSYELLSARERGERRVLQEAPAPAPEAKAPATPAPPAAAVARRAAPAAPAPPAQGGLERKSAEAGAPRGAAARARGEVADAPAPAPAEEASLARDLARRKAAPEPAAAPRAAPAPAAGAVPAIAARSAPADPFGPIRERVGAIGRDRAAGRLAESVRAFRRCAPGEDLARRLYRDADGRAVEYVREVEEGDAALTLDHYYDRDGRLRYAFVRARAGNGTVVEHRIFLGPSGERIQESQEIRRGPGYPFPSVWPEEELATRPEAAFAAPARCPEIGAGGAR